MSSTDHIEVVGRGTLVVDKQKLAQSMADRIEAGEFDAAIQQARSYERMRNGIENPYELAIDEELIRLELGTVDSFDTAKEALDAIIDWHLESYRGLHGE